MQLDNKAWEVLFAQYYPMAYRSAVVIVHDKHLALDVVQESFYKAYCKIGQLQDVKKFKSWLGSIVTNTALDMVRGSKKTVSWEEMDWQSEAEGIWQHSDNNEPEISLVKIELREEILTCLKELTFRQRQVILLKYYWDMTEVEIANYLDCKQGTVKSNLFRGRAKLAQLLSSSGNNEKGVVQIVQSP